MAPDEPPALTRRALRESGAIDTLAPGDAPQAGGDTRAVAAPAEPRSAEPDAAVAAPAEGGRPGIVPDDAREITEARPPLTPRALTWIDAASVAASPARLPADDAAVPDLLGRPPRRSPLRPGVLVPTALIALVLGAYSATTLLWPLHEVAPTIEAQAVQPTAAPAATPAWPGVGSASLAVSGVPGSLSSTVDPQSIASITKVVTALTVLDEMPLNPGEQGPEFQFSAYDGSLYWQYRANGESAVEVPIGGSLTQYQMLEAMLIGSGNNYADRLANNLWPTDAVFAAAANDWLRTHGVEGVTVVEPTGLDAGNIATPDALIVLAQKALANPVIAEIVAKPGVELPGVGYIQNTNGLLADPGVVGIKTGTLDTWNLLTAKDITVGDAIIRTYAAVLGQPDNDSRLAASRALYAQLEAELQPQTAVAAGTTVGRVETAWGDDIPIVTASDADLTLWNGGAPTAASEFALGDARADGAVVGTLTLTAPLGTTVVDLELTQEIEDPSPWWRLTHPLELFGLDD